MKFFSEPAAAAWLSEQGMKTTSRTLFDLRNSGDVSFRKHGGRIYYAEEDLIEYIEGIKVSCKAKENSKSDNSGLAEKRVETHIGYSGTTSHLDALNAEASKPMTLKQRNEDLRKMLFEAQTSGTKTQRP